MPIDLFLFNPTDCCICKGYLGASICQSQFFAVRWGHGRIHHHRELLRDCLISIYKHTTEINFEVIVSDNGSVDGSIEMLKQDFPQVVLIENNANLGFGRENNRGLAVAMGKSIGYRDSYRSFESFPNLNKLHRQYICFLIDSSDFVSGTDNKARLNGHIVS